MTDVDFRLVLDALPDAVVACEADGRIVYVNRAVETLLGWPPQELVGQALPVLIPKRMLEAHDQAFQRYVETREPKVLGRRLRVPARRRDGTEIDVELALSAVRVGGEDLLIAAVRDLRERIELERQLSILGYLRAATAASARLSSRLDLEHVLGTVVDTLVHDFSAALARIWLYEAATHTLHLRASAGLSTRTADSPRARIEVATYPYKLGEVARTRRPFVRNGLAGDPQFDQDWVAREQIAAVAAYPLLVGGELRGVLVCFWRQPLSAEVVEALAAFAAVATATLNDVRLFAREQTARAQAEEARRRAAFLAEASRLLSGSLDFAAALAAVARLAVPELADACTVHTVEPGGDVRLVAAAHSDPAREERARELERRYPWDPNAPFGVARVLRTGQPEVFNDVPDAVLAASARDGEHLRLLREQGLKSYLIVPLVARGRTLGALTLAAAESGRRYHPEDLTLAEDLGRRAALAVDNARLYQEAQDAVRAREQFLSIASHELRTPLTPLHLQVQLLLRYLRQGTLDKLGPERLRGMLEISERQVKQLMKLINDLLDVSRITAGRLELNPEELDLAALVRDVMARFAPELAQAGCTAEVRAEQEVAGCWDRMRLEQVVTNLLSNAMKYGAGKPVTLAVTADGATARLTVSDQGIGIAPEDQHRIFERFERAVTGQEYRGLGLGLYIVRQIVEALGGTIGVASRPGAGSTFRVELPRYRLRPNGGPGMAAPGGAAAASPGG